MYLPDIQYLFSSDLLLLQSQCCFDTFSRYRLQLNLCQNVAIIYTAPLKMREYLSFKFQLGFFLYTCWILFSFTISLMSKLVLNISVISFTSGLLLQPLMVDRDYWSEAAESSCNSRCLRPLNRQKEDMAPHRESLWHALLLDASQLYIFP